MANYKTRTEADEMGQLSIKNPRLTLLVHMLDDFVGLEFHKNLTVTEVYRTQAEHDALYAQTPIEKRPTTSPHCRWQAVDIRSTDFTQSEIDRMLTFLNVFSYAGGQRKVAMYHAIAGNVYHFHIHYV